jgi:hypothetical protein
MAASIEVTLAIASEMACVTSIADSSRSPPIRGAIALCALVAIA